MSVTREDYLERAIEELRPLFATASVSIPKVHVAIGFPSRGGLRSHFVSSLVLGECWNGKASADGCPQIHINPIIPDNLRILDVLVHELCHAVLPEGTGHGPEFAKLAHAVLLTGKPTATVATPELTAHLEQIVGRLGPIPHATLLPGQGLVELPPGFDPKLPPGSPMPPILPRQTTRMRLYECSHGQKIRAATDELQATCNVCGSPFERR